MAKIGSRAYGVLAEFSGTGPLLSAAKKIHEAGYKKYDCHSPFPIHGMDQAMGMKRSPIGYMVGFTGACGLLGMLYLTYWVSVVEYPLVISGKPLFSWQAYVPPVFAITILVSAFMATFGMLVLNKLPRFNHPLFNSESFKRFSDGGFFISLEAGDPKYDEVKVTEFLKSIGATKVEVVTDE